MGGGGSSALQHVYFGGSGVLLSFFESLSFFLLPLVSGSPVEGRVDGLAKDVGQLVAVARPQEAVGGGQGRVVVHISMEPSGAADADDGGLWHDGDELSSKQGAANNVILSQQLGQSMPVALSLFMSHGTPNINALMEMRLFCLTSWRGKWWRALFLFLFWLPSLSEQDGTIARRARLGLGPARRTSWCSPKQHIWHHPSLPEALSCQTCCKPERHLHMVMMGKQNRLVSLREIHSTCKV